MPNKRYRSCLNLGKDMSLIALNFSGSGDIRFPEILCPKNLSFVAQNTPVLI